MSTKIHKVAIVTGASSGIGEITVLRLIDAGYKVYAGARRVERMQSLASAGAVVKALDVTIAASIAEFVNAVVDAEGRIDVLVNNAGYGSYGAVEDIPLAEARRQFDVNLFGLSEMTTATLPTMRAQRSGTVIHIGSIGGKMWSLLGGWYQASKYALEGLADCTRNELRPFGINVVLIEPGGVKSEWRENVIEIVKNTSGSGPYKKLAEAAVKFFEGAESLEIEPTAIADVIVKASQSKRPKARYVVPVHFKLVLLLKVLLTDRMFDRLWCKFMGVPTSV
jgi:NAD(P)-dependent dehydrogenase (short-subunit alcohol dehydrogenase family)|tara:strand:- start:131 stop:970 length:840 start_codon:yes stop_codon:yes gene_type:complete